MSTLDSKKCFVEGKIQAIYETKVIKNAQSGKRKGQLFKVVPTEELRKEFKESLKPSKCIVHSLYFNYFKTFLLILFTVYNFYYCKLQN